MFRTINHFLGITFKMAIEVGNKVIFITDKELFHYQVFRRPLNLNYKLIYRILVNLRLFIISKIIRYSILLAKKKGKIVICHFGNNFDLDNVEPEVDYVLAPAKHCKKKPYSPDITRFYFTAF